LRPAGNGKIYRIVKVAVGSIEIWMVKHVGGVGADLQTDALREVESLPTERFVVSIPAARSEFRLESTKVALDATT